MGLKVALSHCSLQSKKLHALRRMIQVTNQPESWVLKMQFLGQKTVAKGILKELHMHAITSLHNIIKERRYPKYVCKFVPDGTICQTIKHKMMFNLC